MGGKNGERMGGESFYENKCPGNVVCFDGEVVNEEG